MIPFRQQQPASAGFFTTKKKENIMPDLDREEQKEIVKEAIREWLDERYSEFGKWTLHGLLAASLAALAYYLALHGGLK